MRLMLDLILWLIVIPCVVMAAKFWLSVARWLTRNKQTLGHRVQRVRSAFEEGMQADD